MNVVGANTAAITVVTLTFLTLGTLTAPPSAANDTETPGTEPTLAPSPLTVTPPAVAISEIPFVLTATDPALPAGTPLIAQWATPWNNKASQQVAFTDDKGTASFTIGAWDSITVSIATPAGTATQTLIAIQPGTTAVKDPARAPTQPRKYRTNPDPAAQGKGPNPTITRLSHQRKKQMTGLSWRPGCIPFTTLREVHVNYWGMDGYRHRGTLIVNTSVAKRTARLFSDLYRQKFRIQSMHPVDMYGKNPRGPGANDYASMSAGNTSAFNCRYVVGRESQHAQSPHSGGRALDVNPWHNPYSSRTGTYPNSWWLRRTGEQTFLGQPRTLKTFHKHGWSWGGSYGDYHHFDFRG